MSIHILKQLKMHHTKKNTIKVGSDFSGVGAFNVALKRLNIDFEELFACDMDKYARQTFIHNHGQPNYYPADVYEREIPDQSLDVYMTSPPCQAFSLAGRRLGKEDKRGILFFNSLEFIEVNKPRFFIFENVKGLLSDNGGRTFSEWVNLLGGKSINGLPVIFSYEDSVPYHLYYKVLNARDYGVPQNRERIFLIGIRDDTDNVFSFPREQPLSKVLKDVIDADVDDKYLLSDTLKQWIVKHRQKRQFANKYPSDVNQPSPCITSHYGKMGAEDPYVFDTKGIRKLTPRECFRIMDFPETFSWNVSNSQAYKQAGNSIVVSVLCRLIEKFKL